MVEAAGTPVVIVEDHAVMAEALAMALRLQGFTAIEVFTGKAIRDDAVLASAESAGSALVLLDVMLGGGRTSMPLITPLCERGATVLMLTALRDPRVLVECLEAGAAGVFDKAQPFDQLVELLGDAVNGRSVMSVSAREELLRAVHAEPTEGARPLERFQRLTGREQDVLRGLVDGRSPDEIAREAIIAVSTVRTHIKAVLRKLGVNSQLAAVALARSAGWPPDS